MKTKIIISNTHSRFLNILKTNLIHHTQDIDAYVVSLNDIFKAYDIIKPKHIYIADQDQNHKGVELLAKDEIFKNDGCSIHYSGNDFLNIIDTKVYYNKQLNRNNTLAIMFSLSKNTDLLEILDKQEIPYHIFDSPHISHKYNIGLLTDEERSNIMNTYCGLVSFNQEYIAEAHNCGCSHYDIAKPENILTGSNQTSFKDTILDINLYIKNKLYE